MRSLIHFATAAFLSSAVAQGALVIYYPLDESSGNMAFDAAIADGAQDATAAIAASNWQVAAGIVGGGLQLSPTAQADVDEALIYNTANTSTSLLSGTPFTITLWFKTTNTSAFNRMGVFMGNSTLGSSYYSVGLDAGHHPVQVARNTTAVNTVASPTGNDGLWHQLTAVYSATNSRSFYLDGRLAGTNTTNVGTTNLTMNRFGVGALTRNTPTDAFNGLLDEVGLFDTAVSAREAALFNAFPRYDQVRLDDPDYSLALNVFDSQSGSVTTGNWTWGYATGLAGTTGDTGFSGGNPYVVLDAAGNGLAAVPEPAAGALALAGAIAFARRRR
jgi:hypothetical protein